ncbi:hypothetical protein ABPG75_000305 [Micractinium tetrahymenae]
MRCLLAGPAAGAAELHPARGPGLALAANTTKGRSKVYHGDARRSPCAEPGVGRAVNRLPGLPLRAAAAPVPAAPGHPPRRLPEPRACCTGAGNMLESAVMFANGLAAGLASGGFPSTATGHAVRVEQVRRKAALCLLCLLRDSEAGVAQACRAACWQQLQQALAAAEREGGEEGAAVAALLRQAAALVGSQPARLRRQ